MGTSPCRGHVCQFHAHDARHALWDSITDFKDSVRELESKEMGVLSFYLIPQGTSFRRIEVYMTSEIYRYASSQSIKQKKEQ